MTPVPRPPFDPDMESTLEVVETQLPRQYTTEWLVAQRSIVREPSPLEMACRAHPGMFHEERVIPGYGGDEITVSIVFPSDRQVSGPGIYYLHGGGMIMGDRFTGADRFTDWAEANRAVAVSVEYRLAPAFQDPAPVEDAYAGLLWFSEHAAELGVDPSRIAVAGSSAGGGLAAGIALLARDRGGPAIRAQLLQCPMLDDRNNTVSARQFVDRGSWTGSNNEFGWSALLGDRRGTDDVSIYSAPGRATDLSGLPPALIDVGSAEVFRDEDVAYATRIWASGGVAELHVWPGGFHGFDVFAPDAEMSKEARRTRAGWLARQLAG